MLKLPFAVDKLSITDKEKQYDIAVLVWNSFSTASSLISLLFSKPGHIYFQLFMVFIHVRSLFWDAILGDPGADIWVRRKSNWRKCSFALLLLEFLPNPFFLTQISSLPDYLPLGHWGHGGAKLLIASSNDASVWEFEWHLFTERLNWQFSLPVAQVILWVVYICLARHKMEKGWQSLGQNKQNNIDGKKIHLKDEKYWLWTPNNYIGRKIIDACIN